MGRLFIDDRRISNFARLDHVDVFFATIAELPLSKSVLPRFSLPPLSNFVAISKSDDEKTMKLA